MASTCRSNLAWIGGGEEGNYILVHLCSTRQPRSVQHSGARHEVQIQKMNTANLCVTHGGAFMKYDAVVTLEVFNQLTG